MAGVPKVMQAMFEALAPTLEGGVPTVSRAVHAVGVFEGTIATPLGAIQEESPGVSLGSYPYYRASGNGVAIVARGTDGAAVEAVILRVAEMLRAEGAEPVLGEPGAG
jgi:molybdopterin-biosynthesis enzyme MoeA-like protein